MSTLSGIAFRRAPTTVFRALAVLVGPWFAWCGCTSDEPPGAARPTPTDPVGEILSFYAGSESCRECHPDAFAGWKDSHHALAEREVVPEIDGPAFDPPRSFKHGSQESESRARDGSLEIVTLGIEGRRAHPVEGVFGVYPLRQFLIPAAGGRYQVSEVAWDPERREWFDVYGDEDRKPGEWGHWTGRGMNWNSMCATCHNTRFFKSYNPQSDTYSTRRAERGVGCEACHGPLGEHVEWQRQRVSSGGKDPTVRRFSRDQILDTCGSCHSRRVEVSGDFVPGDAFLEHFTPTIPDETDIYYPDGQVREEDFEYVSFLGSVMHSKDVRCVDCHNPHTAKTKYEGNDLCLQCHRGKVDPGSHSHHELGTPGSFCVDCHMPLTTYMQRHPRRDHGFTIPDPLLTKEHGVPNACTRCHVDEGVDWAVEAVGRWYGDPLKRPTQRRARTVARARAGDGEAREALIQLVREEPIPLWRAVATGLLQRWLDAEPARSALIEATRDPHPLVRATAARTLEPVVGQGEGPEIRGALLHLLADSSRSVRVGAAWTLRREVDPLSRAGKELGRHLAERLDQPDGRFRVGVYHMDRGPGYPKEALPYLRTAVSWDSQTPAFRQALAVCLSQLGKTHEAAKELEEACRLAPTEPAYHFYLGLALGELNRHAEAEWYLARAVKLDGSFVRAWYNLGLVRDRVGKVEPALEALQRAEDLDATNPEAPYARATILFRHQRYGEAITAANRALEIAPELQAAQQLIHAAESAR